MLRRSLVFACFVGVQLAACFNFDIRDSHVFSNTDLSDRSFGRAVLLQKGAPPIVTVGAPQVSSSFYPSVTRSGSVFRCNLDQGNRCAEYNVRNSGDLRNGSLLGMTIDGGESSNDPIVVCAPKWYTIQHSDETDVYYANGQCFFARNSNTPTFTVLKPLSSNQVVVYDGKARYFNAMGEVGMSLKYMEGDTLLMGAPGVFSWGGTVVKAIGQTFQTPNPRYFAKDKIHDESYLGYAITSGVFQGTTELYVAGAPRGARLLGQVFVFDFQGDYRIDLKHEIKGFKLGSYFGASLATARLTGTGAQLNLLIGAPTHSDSEDRFDEGRVFVFGHRGDNFMLFYELDGVGDNCLERRKAGSRFGTAISNLGVHSAADKHETIAIAAPFENGGRGAIYIYKGGSKKPKCSQRIEAQSGGYRGFGYSLSKAVDIDSNNFNDLAVGGTGQVTVIKSRPVVDVKVFLSSSSTNLLQNSTEFTLRQCVRFIKGKSSTNNIQIDGRLTLDSRAFTQIIPFKLDISTTDVCDDFPVRLKRNSVDFVNNFKINSSFSVEDCSSCPIIEADNQKYAVLEIPYTTDCGSDNICNTDLKVDAAFDRSSLILGSDTKIGLNVNVRNLGEPAYLCKINMNISSDISLTKCPSNCVGICKGPSLECSVENPLKTEKPLTFEFDVTGLSSKIKDINVSIEASSAGVGKNPVSVAHLPLEVQLDGSISGNSIPDTVLPGKDANLEQAFNLRNNGPSPFENLEVFFSVPIKPKDSEEMFLDVSEPSVDNEVSCRISRDMNHDVEAIPPPEKIPLNVSTILNCLNMDCLTYVCRVGNLKKFNSVRVRFHVNARVSKIVEYYQKGTDSKDILVISTTAHMVIGDKRIIGYANTYIHRETEKSIAWWIIIVALIGASILLFLIIFGLYKCNFFKRQRVPQEELGSEPLQDKVNLSSKDLGVNFEDLKEEGELTDDPS